VFNNHIFNLFQNRPLHELDQSFNLMITDINHSINSFCPIKTVKVSSKARNHKVTSHTLNLMQRRDNAYKSWKQTHNNYFHERFKLFSLRVKKSLATDFEKMLLNRLINTEI